MGTTKNFTMRKYSLNSIIMSKIKEYYSQHPLKSLLIIALLVRLIAVVFSQGYGFHDDHFLVIEAAQSWVDANLWNDWMPYQQEKIYPGVEPVAEGHSLVYPGVHYVMFQAMEFLGIYNPKAKMYLVRLIHALFSLLIVLYGYKIAKHYAGNKIAKTVGLILALLFVMPFLSVHNLVEVVCIPFLMWGLWLTVKLENKQAEFKNYLWAGFVMALAVSIRFQTAVVVAGAGLVLLFRKQWKDTFAFGLGALLSFVLMQSVIDVFVWGKPLAEFAGYVKYNLAESGSYGHNIWYMFTTVLGGIVIPPLGVFVFIGWFLVLRKQPLLFWPSFLFFAFHNYFPNKQERFILPILPLFILAGVVGWWQYMDKSEFWNKNRALFKPVMVIFWVLNFMALPVLSTTYSKRSRCETMYYFRDKDDVKAIIVEESVRGGATQMPVFYAAKEINMYQQGAYELSDSITYDTIRPFLDVKETILTPAEIEQNNWVKPDYVVFINEKQLDERISKMKNYYPNLEYEATINPSYMDMLMRKITPSNNNQLVFIYKVKL